MRMMDKTRPMKRGFGGLDAALDLCLPRPVHLTHENSSESHILCAPNYS
jgi:hypothetical protein